VGGEDADGDLVKTGFDARLHASTHGLRGVPVQIDGRLPDEPPLLPPKRAS